MSNYEYVSIVRKSPTEGTKVKQAQLTLTPGSKEELKLLIQFDASRNEVFFANKVMFVEGPSERYSLPHIFKLKGIDINREGISIIDSGGKENMEFFIKILKEFEIPFIVLHDEDRNANNYQSYHARPNGLNAKIESAVGNPNLIFKADPDFEGVLGLSGKDKVRDAITKARNLKPEEIPEVINDAIKKIIQL